MSVILDLQQGTGKEEEPVQNVLLGGQDLLKTTVFGRLLTLGLQSHFAFVDGVGHAWVPGRPCCPEISGAVINQK